MSSSAALGDKFRQLVNMVGQTSSVFGGKVPLRRLVQTPLGALHDGVLKRLAELNRFLSREDHRPSPARLADENQTNSS